MRKILTLAMTLCVLFTILVPFSASAETTTVDSGTCGENVTWVLDSDGVLTISGNGEMTNWTWYDAVSWFDYIENVRIIEKVIIEDGVTSIGDSAFSDCDSLISVTIPNSVKSIGNDAFTFCEGLTSMTIGNGVTSIGESAFEACPNLTSVTMGNSVTSIGNNAFSSCNSLTSVTIPNSVTSIGQYAFYNCKSLTSVTMGNGVTSIGQYAFDDCESLTNIDVDVNNSAYCSIDGVLFNKNITTIIRYPEGKTQNKYIIPNSVTNIGNNAFSACSVLISVTIPNSVTSIGQYAFYNCGLTSMTIPNSVTSIGNNAFSYCTGLTDVTIGNSVTSIGNNAFYYCGLTNVTIPGSVTSIGNDAFSNCYYLKSMTIPNSVTSIGNSAFYYCPNFKNVYYRGSEDQWNEIIIESGNDYLKNATRNYILKMNILYNPNGGTGELEVTEADFDSKVTLPSDAPTRFSYNFLGWAKSPDAAVAEYKPGDIITVGTKDMTLYAVWEKSVYTTTTIDSDGNFEVTPKGIPTGSCIMLACYKDGNLVCIDKCYYEDSETVQFSANEEYDKVKVLVWEDISKMNPITQSEDIGI